MINWALKSRGTQPIGLDIGADSIKMIQLMVDGGQISVLAADKVTVDPTINGDWSERRTFIISAIREMLERGSFRGRNVVSCLPNDKLKITSLRLTVTDNGQIEQVLRKEIAQRFGMDPDKDSINYIVAGQVNQGDEIKSELILFAAENENTTSHLEMLKEAQLRPTAIDPIPCAIFRSFERQQRRHEDKKSPAVFVDMGSQFTTVVFGRDQEISFAKQIPIGGGKFNREIAVKLGVSISEAGILRRSLQNEKLLKADMSDQTQPAGENSNERINLDVSTRHVIIDSVTAVAEELAREISLCFRYCTVTFRGKQAERAFFSGGEAYEGILLNILKRQLAVETEIAQPLKGFDRSRPSGINFDSDKRGLLCEWAVAVGLALKGVA